MIGSATGSFKAGFRSSGGASEPWTPASHPSLAFWIDASDTNSYTVSGNNIATISDKTGNFSLYRDGTPQRAYNAVGFMPAFYFSGSESFMSSNTSTMSDGDGNHWAIGLFRWDQVNNSKDSAWSYNGTRTYALSAGASNRWDGEIDYDGDQTINGHAKNQFNTSIAQNTFAIVTVVFDRYSDQIYGRINGRSRTPGHEYDLPMDTNTDIRIFRNRGNHRTRGYMAEMFHVAARPGTGDKGDVSDVEKAEGYLAHKWGLAGNLPSQHPYSISPP